MTDRALLCSFALRECGFQQHHPQLSCRLDTSRRWKLFRVVETTNSNQDSPVSGADNRGASQSWNKLRTTERHNTRAFLRKGEPQTLKSTELRNALRSRPGKLIFDNSTNNNSRGGNSLSVTASYPVRSRTTFAWDSRLLRPRP